MCFSGFMPFYPHHRQPSLIPGHSLSFLRSPPGVFRISYRRRTALRLANYRHTQGCLVRRRTMDTTSLAFQRPKLFKTLWRLWEASSTNRTVVILWECLQTRVQRARTLSVCRSVLYNLGILILDFYVSSYFYDYHFSERCIAYASSPSASEHLQPRSKWIKGETYNISFRCPWLQNPTCRGRGPKQPDWIFVRVMKRMTRCRLRTSLALRERRMRMLPVYMNVGINAYVTVSSASSQGLTVDMIVTQRSKWHGRVALHPLLYPHPFV